MTMVETCISTGFTTLQPMRVWVCYRVGMALTQTIRPRATARPRASSDNGISCWSGVHDAYVFFAICVWAWFFPAGLVFAATENEYNPYFYHIPRFSVALKGCKFLIALGAAFLCPYSPLGFVIAVAVVVLMIFLSCLYFQPYLGKQKNHIFNNGRTASYAGVLWAFIMAIVVQGKQDPTTYTYFYIYIGLLVPIMAGAWFLNNWRAQRVPTVSNWTRRASRSIMEMFGFSRS